MVNEDEDGDSPAKCRERRRRRIEMRRSAAISASGGSSSPGTTKSKDETTESSNHAVESKRLRTAEANAPPSPSPSPADEAEVISAAADVVPVFGTMSVIGRCREMEDALFVRTNLCRPEICRRRPVHFFGVYDGHGGPHVAALCRDKLHVLMEEELMRVVVTQAESGGCGAGITNTTIDEGRWRRVIMRCFERMDEVALSGIVEDQYGCQPVEVALTGSTAVVVILTPEHIIVANCGDSRAVLCRRGRAVTLSSDHKPDRADELARIQAAGGRVIFINGARVEGILGMSRAIGDEYLKPIVISEPEITFTKRDPEDECLILASDGLWDTLSNDMACEVASECLREKSRPSTASRDLNTVPPMEKEGDDALYPSRSSLAAVLLTRLALGRKSSDNISVIVVDLKRS